MKTQFRFSNYLNFYKSLTKNINRSEENVRTRRLELPREKIPLAPQASASTNSATCAN